MNLRTHNDMNLSRPELIQQYNRCLETVARLAKDRTRLIDALKEAKCFCEQAIGHLTDGGNGSKHDPSWIRPMAMSKTEMVNACQQAYHNIHATLATINKALEGVK